MFKRIFPAISGLFLVAGVAAAQGAAKSPEEIRPWKHLKSVAIVGKDWASAQTNYAIMIVCRKGAGQDAGENACLGEDVRDDFGDIRFRGASGELAYWMEKCVPGKQAAFWVNVPIIPAKGTVAVSLAYGNPEAATTSDGKKTFRFFEDFPGDYTMADKKLPDGWELRASYGRVKNWIVKDNVIRYKDNGHVTTIEPVWPDPREETYVLRSSAMWPDPPFHNPKENGASVGGISMKNSHGNAHMDIVSLYQKKGKTSGSFGIWPRNLDRTRKEMSMTSAEFYSKYELKLFKEAHIGKFITFEIERKPDETIARLIATGEEVRSTNVIPDRIHPMIHACELDYPESAYISVDWMLLRRQAYPAPSYGEWTSLK